MKNSSVLEDRDVDFCGATADGERSFATERVSPASTTPDMSIKSPDQVSGVLCGTQTPTSSHCTDLDR